MAPTESTILTNFLLSPASLSTIITLRQFTDLFPSAKRSNPQIKLLYRELQHQRALIIDQVRRNITAEANRGERQRREVVRERRQVELDEMDEEDYREIEMETEVRLGTLNVLYQES